MRKNQQLVIVLPESSEELPIRIVSGSRSMELRLCLCPPDGEERHVNETCPERKYVFVWRQNDYLKTAVDEIQWIEAAGSIILHVQPLFRKSVLQSPRRTFPVSPMHNHRFPKVQGWAPQNRNPLTDNRLQIAPTRP